LLGAHDTERNNAVALCSKARTTEQLAAAYRAMNIRDGG
jgi:hypothetical protein